MNFLLLVSSENYMSHVIKILKEVYDEQEQICYVCYSRTFKSVVNLFHKSDINDQNVFFIDCLSRSLMKVSPTFQCKFVSSPAKTNEILDQLKKIGEVFQFKNMIFDSVSNLKDYLGEKESVTFISEVAKICDAKGYVGIFTALVEDKEEPLIQKIQKVVDKTIYAV